MWGFWWPDWHRGGFNPTTSVYYTNSDSTNCSTLILIVISLTPCSLDSDIGLLCHRSVFSTQGFEHHTLLKVDSNFLNSSTIGIYPNILVGSILQQLTGIEVVIAWENIT
jgi:hypothetical protein